MSGPKVADGNNNSVSCRKVVAHGVNNNDSSSKARQRLNLKVIMLLN